MKLIAVLEIDDEYFKDCIKVAGSDSCAARFEITNNDTRLLLGNGKAEKLPDHIFENILKSTPQEQYEARHWYACGFNSCLDEISFNATCSNIIREVFKNVDYNK